MKKIYKFLGKHHSLFSNLTIPIGFWLGFVLSRCFINQLWVWFGVIIFVILIWLVVVVISAHSYEHLYKDKW